MKGPGKEIARWGVSRQGNRKSPCSQGRITWTKYGEVARSWERSRKSIPPGLVKNYEGGRIGGLDWYESE